MTGKIKNRLPPFVPLLISTIDTPAWKAMSHGARSLYIALRRRVPNGRNRAFISQRNAQQEIRANRRSIARWFGELEHYGFIVLMTPGSLGVEGKGKAPHWRLTELGNTSAASAQGCLEPPTRDFLKWDGSVFQEKQNPGAPAAPPWCTEYTTPGAPAAPLIVASGAYGVAIEPEASGADGGAITSLPLPPELPRPAPAHAHAQLSERKNINGAFPELPKFLRRANQHQLSDTG